MPRKGKTPQKRMPDTSLSNPDPEVQEESQKMHRSAGLRKMEALSMLNGATMPSKFRFRDKELERMR